MSGGAEATRVLQGRHFTEYVDEVRSLKREGRLEEAARLRLNLVRATEAESRATGDGIAPWYYEHLAIPHRKQKNPVNEERLLVRFAEQVHAPGVGPEKLFKRLHAVGVSEGRVVANRSTASGEPGGRRRVADGGRREACGNLSRRVASCGADPSGSWTGREAPHWQAAWSRLCGGRRHLGVRGRRLDHEHELWVIVEAGRRGIRLWVAIDRKSPAHWLPPSWIR